jgi:hypothetical protein
MSRIDTVHDRLIPPLPATTNQLGRPVRCHASRSSIHFCAITGQARISGFCVITAVRALIDPSGRRSFVLDDVSPAEEGRLHDYSWLSRQDNVRFCRV